MKLSCRGRGIYEVRFTEDEIEEMNKKCLETEEEICQALETWITNGISGD